MAAALVASLSHVPTPARSTSGTRKAGSDIEELLDTVIRLLLLHDRSIQALEDRTSVSLIVRDNAVKNSIVDARSKWQAVRPTRSTDDSTEATPGREALVHPMKCSLKSLVHAILIVAIQTATAARTDPGKEHAKKCVDWLASLDAATVDKYVFRLKPRHKDPHQNGKSPWVWSLMFAAVAPPDFIQAWLTLAQGALEQGFTGEEPPADSVAVAVRPAKSKDMKLAQILRSHLSTASMKVDEDDDMESADGKGTNGRKARRR